MSRTAQETQEKGVSCGERKKEIFLHLCLIYFLRTVHSSCVSVLHGVKSGDR